MGLGQGNWFRLNIPAIVFCIGWCTLFITLSTDCLDEKLEEAREQGVRIVEIRRVYNAVLRYPVVVASSAGVMCYVGVSWRIPRPPMLHWHGFVFLVMVLEGWVFLRQICFITGADTDYYESKWNIALNYWVAGFKRIILVTLMILKIDALGPPLSCLVNIRLWGRILNVCQGFYHIFIGPLPPLWSISQWDRGFSRAEIRQAKINVVGEPEEVDTDPIDDVVVPFSVYAVLVGVSVLIVVRLVFCSVATRLVWHTMQKLTNRKASSDQLRKVRIVLWQHVAGMWLVLVTGSVNSVAVVWQTLQMHEVLGWEEPMTPQSASLAFLIDSGCDVIGILLLSGILGLLVKEQEEGGDISAHIRGILHSAVLTSRGESVFEGRVMQTALNVCVVSFPGKHWVEWNELTWFCEREELSSACVFLPQGDRHQRFGRHDVNPNTPGQCWCHSMYGAEKPWGCAWFSAWMANVEMAVRLNLELVVVFFPGETNQGIVDWEDLRSRNLWDGVGLGGSQKVEVAWLTMKGYRYTSEDISVTKQRFDQQRNTPSTRAITARSNSSVSNARTPRTPGTNTPSTSNLWGLQKTSNPSSN